MTQTLKPDLCVVGAGAGGLSVAAAAAAFGVSAVLIERHEMGGECLNTGCVPSKALLAAAKRVTLMRSAEAFGIIASSVHVDFAKVRDHVEQVIATIAPNDSAERFTGLGVRVIKGQARFTDRRTVVVGSQYQIRARRFVIATGSTSAVPAISGIDTGPYFTNESIFQLTALPQHLIVIGAGSTGLELAQAFRRFGSAVTLLESATPLAREDPEAVAIVLAQLERDGIVIRSGIKVARVSHANGCVTVTIEDKNGAESIDGTHLLFATGRQPAIDGLDLEAAGVRWRDAGIIVNRALRTSNRRIYAIGDVLAGQPRLTHAATYHSGLVIRNALFRLQVRVNGDAIPRVIFTEPELAQAGITEAEARSRRSKIHILRWPYHDNDRALTEREGHGHIKVIADQDGKILGATIVGARAGELVAIWVLAIAQQLNIRALAEIVLPYPTLSEIGKRVAIDFFAPHLKRSLLRSVITWLRIFG